MLHSLKERKRMQCPTLRKGGPQNLIYKPVKARLSRAKKRKTGGNMLWFFFIYHPIHFFARLGIRSFSHCSFAHLLRLLRPNEWLWANHSGYSMLMSKERPWANRSGGSWQKSDLNNLLSSLMIKEQIRESFVFLAKGSFTLFLTKKGDSLKKIWLKLYFSGTFWKFF